MIRMLRFDTMPTSTEVRWEIQSLNFSTGKPVWVHTSDITDLVKNNDHWGVVGQIAGMKRNCPLMTFRIARVTTEIMSQKA